VTPAPRLSVAIITLNESARIGPCLASVDFADEVVVVDSGSDDDTVRIARQLGARVLVTPDWPGFGPQKNRALEACQGDWVLSIDADEQVDARLRRSIIDVVHGPAPGPGEPVGYWIRRSSRFCGQLIRHGDWRRDRVMRLFRRNGARFTDDPVHERVDCPGPHGELAGRLLHDTVDSVDDMIDKTRRYAVLGAQKLRGTGRRGGASRAALGAAWTFVRGYLLRGGFLDGRAGLTIARLNAWGTWLKYRDLHKEA
jgi:glycosyltransferase involved in cell wall biosynthesis